MSSNENLVDSIVQHLRVISAHDLQILAEEMARVALKELPTSTFFIYGRNAEAQTTKGWPDAFVELDDKRVYGIEATREKQNWEDHLEADLANAKDSNYLNLGGYFYIGGYPKHDPKVTEIQGWTKKFRALGIPAGDVTILIGKHLAVELAKPQYVRVRFLVLGISPSARVFSLLTPSNIASTGAGSFQPTTEDFAKGRIHEPDMLADVVKELMGRRPVLIRGHGASGKTTMACLLSQNPTISPSPSFYFDISDGVDALTTGALKQDMTEYGTHGAVFIVDNIHLNERVAQELLAFWEQIKKTHASSILLLGRETSSAMGSPLGALKAWVLRAGAKELVGVVNRMLARKDRVLPEIRESSLLSWIRTFGGNPSDPNVTVDLIAFSAAVELRLERLRNGDMRLTHEDAVDAMRSHYLSKIKNEKERENLIRIAIELWSNVVFGVRPGFEGGGGLAENVACLE